MRRLLALILLMLPLGLASPAAASSEAKVGPVDFRVVVADIERQVEAALAAYDPAKGEANADVFSSIYFDVFEESGLEAAIGARDDALKSSIERGFGSLITFSGYGEPPAKLQGIWAKMKVELGEAIKLEEQAANPLAAFLQSLLILLREGFEAILVIGALIAYLRRLGAEDKVKVVWSGVAAAVVASLVVAYVVTQVLRLTGPVKEAVEGATMLAAAAVLIYVSHWLLAKREASRWQAYIRERVQAAISGGQLLSLGLAAFLAVFREGAETVLFYQALLSGSAGQEMPIAAGFGVGAVGLVAMYWGYSRASLRIPLGPFFAGTAVLLYALAFTFAGQGVFELQEARWIGATPLQWVPTIPSLGVFPTVQSVLAQALVLSLLIPVAVLWLRRKPAAAA